ncbi:MAG: sigma-70 family RNA polymerase sigma factor [Lachnospiraceae bacterium]|nr:sigma-70 family RNA polymerase sigma factor [Lachnospiraceae bacterium]
MVDNYQNLVFSICYKITGNYFDAEDMTQETFLSAYKNYSKFDGKNEKAWICRIATNKCIDFKRKPLKNQVPTEESFFLEVKDRNDSIEESVINAELKEELFKKCNGLKPPYDQIALFYFYEELTTSQIADKLNRNEKTVQTQIYRAKAMLKKLYEGSG